MASLVGLGAAAVIGGAAEGAAVAAPAALVGAVSIGGAAVAAGGTAAAGTVALASLKQSSSTSIFSRMASGISTAANYIWSWFSPATEAAGTTKKIAEGTLMAGAGVRVGMLGKKKFIDGKELSPMEDAELAITGAALGAGAVGGVVGALSASTELKPLITAAQITLHAATASAITLKTIQSIQKEDRKYIIILLATAGSLGSASALGAEIFQDILSPDAIGALSSAIDLAVTFVKDQGGLQRAQDTAIEHLAITSDLSISDRQGRSLAFEFAIAHSPSIESIIKACDDTVPEIFRHDPPFNTLICPITNSSIRYAAQLRDDQETIYEKTALEREIAEHRLEGDIITDSDEIRKTQAEIDMSIRLLCGQYERRLNTMRAHLEALREEPTAVDEKPAAAGAGGAGSDSN